MGVATGGFAWTVRDGDVAVRDPVIEWLLEPDSPAVRYATLTGLMDRSERSKEVREAKRAIMELGVVPAILAEQNEDGSFGRPQAFYTAKYRGTVWQIMILAEHSADGRDPRVKRACEFLLTHSQERGSGGFSQQSGKKTPGGLPSQVIPCLTGNLVWALSRLGYSHDARVAHGIEWLTRFLRFDDGDTSPPESFPYRHYEMCYGRHVCLMGVVKGLKALAEIPEEKRSAEVRRTMDEGAEFLLKHRIFKRSHNPALVSKSGWKRFGFPRMYQTDVIEILLILFALGFMDDRMWEAIELVRDQRREDGRFLLRDTMNGKFIVDIERKDEPSKWVTLRAMQVLRQAAKM